MTQKYLKKKRMELYEEILLNHECGIGFASPEEIDQLNILEATFFP